MSEVFALLFPRYPTFQLFLSLAIAMFITIVATPLLIRLLRHRNIGQVVRADGPERHLTKQGTPTMGGIILILATAVAYLLVSASRGLSPKGLALLGVFAACGVVGLVDDSRKALKARSLGLRARDKLIAQFVISLAFAYVAITYAGISTDVSIPLTRYVVQLGLAYPLFVALIIMSATNAVNLTDGLDGLAGGTAAIVALAFAGIAFREQMPDVAFFAAAIGGACVGFLWWNAYPAAIFMGDTGSLALGGAIAGLAIVTKTELFLPLIGAIYVAEALSVIIQVAVYRYTRRRVFKMAPIHHHFEMLGWSETQVMLRFWIMTAIFAAWGFALYFSVGR